MQVNGAASFKQAFDLKIKGDLIPEAATEEIIGELQGLFVRDRLPSSPQDKNLPPKNNHPNKKNGFSRNTEPI